MAELTPLVEAWIRYAADEPKTHNLRELTEASMT